MTNQGIARTKIVLHQDEFRNFVGFPVEEVLGLKIDNPCNSGPLLPLDKRSRQSFLLHEKADDFF